jgi:hypothetical protein
VIAHPIGAGIDRQLEPGRDQLLLPFRVGHGDAGRTIDPIDDLLRGPGRSEQRDRIERDHARPGFDGRWKFRSADQAIRAGDRQHPEIAGAMELGLVRRYRRFRSSLIVPEGRAQRPGGGGSGELVAAPGQPPLKSWGLSWLAKEIIRRRDARTYNSRTKPEPVIEPTPNPASDPPPQMPGDPVA